MGLRSVEVCRLMLNEIKYGNNSHIDVGERGEELENTDLFHFILKLLKFLKLG